MEGSVYLKARQEWDERYADLVLGKRNWQITAAVLVVEGSSASSVIDLRPVLITVGFGPVRPGGWMRATSVVHSVRRVGGE